MLNGHDIILISSIDWEFNWQAILSSGNCAKRWVANLCTQVFLLNLPEVTPE